MLAGLPEKHRVNLALELVEGVELGKYYWQGEPKRAVAPKTEGRWEVA